LKSWTRAYEMTTWDWLLDPSGLTPHGFCLSWAPGLVWLHAGSDAVVGLAYFSIPVALTAFAAQRRDVEYGWVLYLFIGFILACGTTHLMSILTLWVPAYGVEGVIKLITAALSIATAVILWPLIPKLVALPSPAQLARLNGELSRTIAEQEETAELLQEADGRLLATNRGLERRVMEQTAELREANVRLSDALAQRTLALHQRDVLLREVYHRVKNNLQIVDGLILLQARQFSDPEVKSALLALRRRVYALGLVHHQLMDSTDLKTFDIVPFLKELSANLLEGSAEQGINLTVDAAPMDVGLDFAIPLGLLVTELVTNALKHAFPDGAGNIAVVLERDVAGEVALVVSDDGRGLLDSDAASVSRRASGLGTSIIAGLVAQLQGTITMRNENGTRAEIRVAAPVLS
jgi:two-component sensor histidine kinase